MLSWFDEKGCLATQSYGEILSALACTPETPSLPPLEKHHDLVRLAIEDLAKMSAGNASMGVMGSKASARWRLFNLLQLRLKEEGDSLFAPTFQKIANDVYQYPLCDYAKTSIHRMFQKGEGAEQILSLAMQYFESDELCAKPSCDDVMYQQQSNQGCVICSMGLSKEI